MRPRSRLDPGAGGLVAPHGASHAAVVPRPECRLRQDGHATDAPPRSSESRGPSLSPSRHRAAASPARAAPLHGARHDACECSTSVRIGAGPRVGDRADEQHQRRIARYEHEQHDDHENRHERHSTAQVEILEAVEPYVGDHQHGDCDMVMPRMPPVAMLLDRECRSRVANQTSPATVAPAGGHGSPWKYRLSAVPIWVLNRASRNAAGRGEEERGHEPELGPCPTAPTRTRADSGASPKQMTSESESVLGAERALRVGQSRDAPVRPVEHHRDEDGRRRRLETSVHSPATMA